MPLAVGSMFLFTQVATGIDGLRERVGEIEQPKNAWIEIARQAGSEFESSWLQPCKIPVHSYAKLQLSYFF